MDTGDRFGQAATHELKKYMAKATRARELRQLQCVFLLITKDWSFEEIAVTVGMDHKSVGAAISRYRTEGISALLVEDGGFQRNHAKLSLAQERALLQTLQEDIDNGIKVTAKHALERLNDKTDAQLTVSNMYDLFYRHRWASSGRNAGWTPNSDPAVSTRDRLTWDEEQAVFDQVEADAGKGNPAYIHELQAALEDALGRTSSRSNVIGILKEHGWKLYKSKKAGQWVNTGNPKRKRTYVRGTGCMRYMTPDEESQLFESFLDATTIKSSHVRAKAKELFGHTLSATTLYNLLRRNGWEKVGSTSTWKRISNYRPKQESTDLHRKRGHSRYHLVSEEQERVLMSELKNSVDRGIQVTYRYAQSEFSRKVGRQLSRQTVQRTLYRNGWRPSGSGKYYQWNPPSNPNQNAK